MGSEGDVKKQEFWKTFLAAVETDPRPATAIRGSSGIEHPVIAVGVDDNRRRVVIISGEHDARSAAVAQVDIQRAFSDVSVLVARPIVVSLGPIAALVGESLGSFELDITKAKGDGEGGNALASIFESKGERLKELLRNIDAAEVNWIAQWMQLIQQISMVEVRTEQTPSGLSSKVIFAKLAMLDPTELDRQLGVCPVPIYELDPGETEVLQRGTDVEAARSVLLKRDLLQYFFPAPDHLALGLVDRGVSSGSVVLDQLTTAVEVGHPLGEPEFTSPATKLADLIDELRARNLVVEGEVGFEITASAESIRSTVRFKPREGVVSKLANNVSIKLDLKDLLQLIKP